MKIYAPFCQICVEEGKNEKSHQIDYENDFHELDDDLIVEATCKVGHITIYYLLHHKFEILFNFGISSILDGNKRGAFINFVGCLEDFYRFCLRIFFYKDETTNKQQEKMFKGVLKLSERQLGAFAALYFHLFREDAPILKNDLINIRNDVIHASKIPSKEETIKYGQGVYDIMINVLKKIKENIKDQLFYCQNEIIDSLYVAKMRVERLSKNHKICRESGFSFHGFFSMAEILYNDDFFNKKTEPLDASLKKLKHDPALQNTMFNFSYKK